MLLIPPSRKQINLNKDHGNGSVTVHCAEMERCEAVVFCKVYHLWYFLDHLLHGAANTSTLSRLSIVIRCM